MSRENNSQCQLLLLHIDQYLDNDLEPGRRQDFDRHVSGCLACRVELDYAKRLHGAVISLPRLDCSDEALEPLQRLFSAAGTSIRQRPGNWWSDLLAVLRQAPAYIRVGIPALAMLLVLAGSGLRLLDTPDEPLPQLALEPGDVDAATPRYTEAEIRQAMADLNLALGYLQNVSEQTGLMVRDRFLLQQLDQSINASFRTRDPQAQSVQDGQANGPI